MTIARRNFLKLAGGASLASSLSSAAVAVSALSSLPPFAFRENRVPMNAANLCPMPRQVIEAEAHYARELGQDLSPASRARVEARKEDARNQIAHLLGASSDEFAIVRNTSEANNIIVQGLPLDAGDEILLWDQNHPSNLVAWDVRAARGGHRVKRFSIPTDIASLEEAIDIIVRHIGAQTRVVSFTHISNTTGLRLPAAEICQALRRKSENLHIHIDGAQTWGAVDFSLTEVDCDSFSASAHKWFMGPREVGILFVREPHIARVWPSVVSVPWGLDATEAPKGARKFDALGQRDDAAVAALADTAALHEVLTPRAIEEQSRLLADRLRGTLIDAGLPLLSPTDPQFTSSVVVLRATAETGPALIDRVLQESGVITAFVGGFRMSPHIYNTPEHIDRVVAATAKLRDLL